jgi:hypothetical protein
MNGTVYWYSHRMKYGLIEGPERNNVMIYEKDIPFLTLLHAGDHGDYILEKRGDGFKAIKIKKISK